MVKSIVAKFRSISTSSPKETRNFVTAVNTSSEITLFLLVPAIENLPRIASRFANVRPWRDFSGWLALGPRVGMVGVGPGGNRADFALFPMASNQRMSSAV